MFNVTVWRRQGLYGDIEVNYFIRKENIGEEDFRVYDNLQIGGEGTLKFLKGQRTQNITVFVNDDIIPEVNETFQIVLKSPTGGALLGKDSIAHVTILVNDAGNGLFRFSDESLMLTLDEPGSRHVGSTRATFTVVRDNGTLGDVVVGWRIDNSSASDDFKSANGSVLFKDGETRKSFIVETVVDTTPEKKERFLIVLSILQGLLLFDVQLSYYLSINFY